MTRFWAIFLSLCVAFISASGARAQIDGGDGLGPPGIPGGGFQGPGGGGNSGGNSVSSKKEKEVREEEGKTDISQKFIDYLPSLVKPVTNGLLAVGLMKAGGGDSGGTTGGSSSKVPNLIPEKMDSLGYKIGFNRTFKDLVNGKALNELFSKASKSPTFSQAQINNNVEPAAFSARQKAAELSFIHMNNTFAILQAAQFQFLNMDETGEAFQQFTSCVSNNIGPDGTDAGNLQAALGGCMSDVDAQGTTNKPYDKSPDSEGFTAGDRPFAKKGNQADVAARDTTFTRQLGGGGKKKWTLTETLFPDSNSKDLKDDFEKKVGNATWEADIKDPKNNPAFALKQTKGDQKPVIGKAEEAVSTKIKDTYKALTELMKEYCDFKKNGKNTGTEPYEFKMEIFWQPSSPEDLNKKMSALSMAGFRFTPIIGEMFMRLFEKDRSYTSGSSGGKEIKCEDLTQNNQELPTIKTAKFDWQYIYAEYAKSIGWGQIVSEYEHLYTYSQRYAQFDYQREAIDALFNTILNAQGHGQHFDFFMEQQRNRADLFKFIQELGQYMQNKVGGGSLKPGMENALPSLGQDESAKSEAK